MKIDFHVHTNHSNDALHSIKNMIKKAKKVGLDGIAITDHNKLFSYKKAKELSKQYKILIIPGIEIGKLGYLKHILALNIKKTPNCYKLEEILDFIKDESGLSIAAHPYSKIGYKNFYKYNFDAVEKINGVNKIQNLKFKNKTKIPELACSDAHATYMLGYTWTEIPHCETVEEILECVRKQKTEPYGRSVPMHHITRLGFTLGFQNMFKILRIIKKESKAYEDTFYNYYRGLWTRS